MTETTQQSGSAGLEVEGQPGVYWCARHKKVQTRLRCGRCEAPICPKCTVYGPTGARCRNCVSYRGSHMYQVKAPQLLIAFVASFFMGLIGAAVLQSTGLFLLLFFAPAIGGVLGPLITRMTGGKRGPVIASFASAGMTGGVLASIAFQMVPLLRAGYGLGGLFNVSILLPVAFLVLAIAGIWHWLK